MSPYLSKHNTKDKIKYHPAKLFLEYIQSKHLDVEYIYSFHANEYVCDIKLNGNIIGSGVNRNKHTARIFALEKGYDFLMQSPI